MLLSYDLRLEGFRRLLVAVCWSAVKSPIHVHVSLMRLVWPSPPPFSSLQVCRDFRRVLVTEADPGSFGSLSIFFRRKDDRSATMYWTSKSLFLDPSFITHNLGLLSRLIGRGRSRRFSKINLVLDMGTEWTELPLHLGAVSSALLLLELDGYKGELVVGRLHLAEPAHVSDLCELAQRFFTPTQLGQVNLNRIGLEGATVESIMARLGRLSKAKNAVSISRLALPAFPEFPLSAVLSTLPPIESLQIGPNWEDWIDECPYDPHQDGQRSLSQISGLANIGELYWFPGLAGGEADALSTLSNLAYLELHHVTLDAWNGGLSTALSALTRLTDIAFNVWDNTVDDGPSESPLSILQPLTLPPSVSNVSLWFRLPGGRTSLRLNCFGRTSVVAHSCRLAVVGLGVAVGDTGSRKFSLRLGPDLQYMSSLKSLAVEAHGSWEDRTSFHFPAGLSCLTGLTSLETDGSCGLNEMPALPGTWVAAGFQQIGE